jgi:glycosyltransferase involved in cell wall biosynthesis
VNVPSVGVVIPTRNRPELLRAALASVLSQVYPGRLRVVVVYDGVLPEPEIASDPRVSTLVNTRTPGLAGTRNTGILSLDTDLVAFCDDDDRWLPGKLAAQVRALFASPSASFATCAIEVEYLGRTTSRLAGSSTVVLSDLLRSRMAMLHSSTFLIRRSALVGSSLGLVAEDAPGSQNEDYDLLLRASRLHPVVHVDVPLVHVLWGRSSFFSDQYSTKISSLRWLLERHPELAAHRSGAARIHGQLACWYAARSGRGDRRSAVRHAGRALRHRWREPRAVIALAAAARLVRVSSVLAVLHRLGRGI